jgi:hypothetical protein
VESKQFIEVIACLQVLVDTNSCGQWSQLDWKQNGHGDNRFPCALARPASTSERARENRCACAAAVPDDS